MWELAVSIFPLALAYTAPLLIIAIGGLYSERSGIVNIGLEGLLGVGAFSYALFVYYTFPSLGGTAIWLGLLVGSLAGGVFSLLHGFATIKMKANQVISGTAINMLSLAVTIYLARRLTGSATIQLTRGVPRRNIAPFFDIPVIGPLLFGNAYITTFIVIGIVALSWYVLYKRPFGLRLRACGENPHAADSMGINVSLMRFIGVFISGLLSGLGGAIIIGTYSGEFSQLTYSGLGFLALASLIFGQWKPWGVLWAATFFGLAKTIAAMSIIIPAFNIVPNAVLKSFPYVITLVALVLFSRNAKAPKALGEPYDAGKR